MVQNKIIILFILILSISVVKAQNTKIVSDLELRSCVEISKEIIDNFELSYAQELRLTKNASTFDKAFAEFGASYKINQYIKIGTDYRFYRNRQFDGDYENQQRWAIKINTKYKIDRFKLKYKIQYQNKDEDFWANDSDNLQIFSLRNKFSCTYNIPKIKLDPEISAEIFRRYYDGTASFNKIRIGAELSYPIKKRLDTKIGYYLDKEINTTQPTSISIIEVGLKFNF